MFFVDMSRSMMLATLKKDQLVRSFVMLASRARFRGPAIAEFVKMLRPRFLLVCPLPWMLLLKTRPQTIAKQLLMSQSQAMTPTL